jgi:argininosuccinate lyase
MVSDLTFNRDAMQHAVDGGYVLATEIADYLAHKGLPFRQAHDIAGALVKKGLAEGRELGQFKLEELKKESPLFEKDVFEWLDVARAVDRRDLPGGPAAKRIRAEIVRSRAELGT